MENKGLRGKKGTRAQEKLREEVKGADSANGENKTHEVETKL